MISTDIIMHLNFFPHRLSCFYSQPKVQVYLKELTDVCSLASKRREYSQIIQVAAKSTRSIPFIIIPMKHGKFPIEVKASVGAQQIDDGVIKTLLVVVSKLYFNNITLSYCNPELMT